jgi:hypothetical protein
VTEATAARESLSRQTEGRLDPKREEDGDVGQIQAESQVQV